MEREAGVEERGRALTVRRLGDVRCVSVAVLFVVAACGREPADKLVGWPPREPIVPVRDVVEDTSAPEADTVVVEVVTLDVPDAVVVPPCRQVVDLVCELQGRFTDACREAQSRTPDDSHPETRDACAALYTSFVETDLPRVGSACARYARELCKTLGDASEPCRTAKGQVAVLTTRRGLRACLGDLLWSRTRTFRR